MAIWTAVETAAAIVGACIPVLRVFFKNTVTSLHDRYYRSDDEASTTAGINTMRSGDVLLSLLARRKSTSTSIRSVLGAGELGTVISNDRGGILQTSTVTVEYETYEQDTYRRWR